MLVSTLVFLTKAAARGVGASGRAEHGVEKSRLESTAMAIRGPRLAPARQDATWWASGMADKKFMFPMQAEDGEEANGAAAPPVDDTGLGAGDAMPKTAVYFSEIFGVSADDLAGYGAFDISLIADLPLFIDPFLLFQSDDPKYRSLHDQMIEYLRFLRDKASGGPLDRGLSRAWYEFPEIKQTWLGFAKDGNKGRGLGPGFAAALHVNLHNIFRAFGTESVTRGSHLEKLCLIRSGVGRDNISDFTTNLIRGFLAEFTQEFAQRHIDPSLRRRVPLPKARFDYPTESWATAHYDLPWHKGDHVILTPIDILTKDDTWINRSDLIHQFDELANAVSNAELRARINNYFAAQLPQDPQHEPSKEDEKNAAATTLIKFPELIDVYIRKKEDTGSQAQSVSAEKVADSHRLYVEQSSALRAFLSATKFYGLDGSTYDEAHQRIAFLKDVVENKGAHRIFYVSGEPLRRERDLQIMYRLTWLGTPSDVSREVDDGRGPADFKISRGADDKTIVEFKLASNTHLRRNLVKQVEIYKAASDAARGIKVILYFSEEERLAVRKVLDDLQLLDDKDIVLIDASKENKPSGSKA
jgi:hypothetical protein